MAEVKINVGSAFHKKYQQSGMTRVDLNVYIYSGAKTEGKGDITYTLSKEPIGSDDYVIFDLTDIIKDYVTPTLNLPLDDNKDYIKWVELQANIVGDKPVAENATVSTEEDTAVTILLTGTDSEFRDLTYSKVSNPSNGIVGSIFNKRKIVYTPNAGFYGQDSFRFKVNNGVRDSDEATITISVYPATAPVTYDKVLRVTGCHIMTSYLYSGTSYENVIFNYKINNNVPASDYIPAGGTNPVPRFRPFGLTGFQDGETESSYRYFPLGVPLYFWDQLFATNGGISFGNIFNEPTDDFGFNIPFKELYAVEDGWYAVETNVALYYVAGCTASSSVYGYDDLPQDIQDAIINPSTPKILHTYRAVLKVSGGYITERHEVPRDEL
jgi:hypothetical protein